MIVIGRFYHFNFFFFGYLELRHLIDNYFKKESIIYDNYLTAAVIDEREKSIDICLHYYDSQEESDLFIVFGADQL